jgi:SAM-dependent methyltransferase
MAEAEKDRADYVPERYWEERYSRLDLTRSGHRDLPEAYNRWLYRRKRAVLARALRAIGFRARGARLLEIGVGTGAYLDFWMRLGVRAITGLDISDTALRFASARYPAAAFLRRDVTAPNLRADLAGDFDLVAALDVLYHVVDDARLETALGNVRDVLRPGGVFALHDQFLHRPSESHGYIRWRSLHDWQRLLGAAGFEIVARTPIFFGMIQPTDWSSPRTAARLDSVWNRSARWIDRLPRLAGAIGYGIDSVLGALLAEGPSMELALARRVG